MHAAPGHWRRLGVLVAALCLTVLAWTGDIDRRSAQYLDDTLLAGGAVYATARGINAVVSLLQGTEVTPVVLTISIGELLDPINDFIERFSAVLLWALGALALQKLLLALVSDVLFNAALSLAFAYLLLAYAFPRLHPARACRLFLLLAFARYALGLMVLCSALVDGYFLHSDEAQQHAAMRTMRAELDTMRAATAVSEAAPGRIEAATRELAQLDDRRRAELAALQAIGRERERSEQELAGLLAQRSLAERLNPLNKEPPTVRTQRAAVAALRQREQAAKHSLDGTESTISALRDTLDCLRKRDRGETCSLWERLQSTVSPAQLSAQITAIEAGTSEFTASAISLLVSLLLRTVLLPLAFLFLAARLFRHWHALLPIFRT